MLQLGSRQASTFLSSEEAERGREGSRRTPGARSPPSPCYPRVSSSLQEGGRACRGPGRRSWRSEGASPAPWDAGEKWWGSQCCPWSRGALRGQAGGLGGTERRERRGPEDGWCTRASGLGHWLLPCPCWGMELLLGLTLKPGGWPMASRSTDHLPPS